MLSQSVHHLGCGGEFVDKCGGQQDAVLRLGSWCVQGRFCIAKAYEFLKDHGGSFECMRTVWENASIPKTRVMLWLAAQNGLPTIDRMTRGWHLVNRCSLFYNASKDMDHLFFSCPVSQSIWSAMLVWMGLNRRPVNLHDELKWFQRKIRGKQIKQKIRRVALAVCVYEIWKGRNSRKFGERSRSIVKIRWDIQYVVRIEYYRAIGRNIKVVRVWSC